MRVVVLGGTKVIGRAIVEEHVHADRRALPAGRLDGDVMVDTYAMCAAETGPVLAAVAGRMRLVVLSSQDVYAAYGELHAGTHGQPVPIDETSPLRTAPLPYG